MQKKPASDFGFIAEELPSELEELVRALEEEEHEASKIRGKGGRESSKPLFRSEAIHYWHEACRLKFETSNEFVAHAIQCFRERFRNELH